APVPSCPSKLALYAEAGAVCASKLGSEANCISCCEVRPLKFASPEVANAAAVIPLLPPPLSELNKTQITCVFTRQRASRHARQANGYSLSKPRSLRSCVA